LAAAGPERILRAQALGLDGREKTKAPARGRRAHGGETRFSPSRDRRAGASVSMMIALLFASRDLG